MSSPRASLRGEGGQMNHKGRDAERTTSCTTSTPTGAPLSPVPLLPWTTGRRQDDTAAGGAAAAFVPDAWQTKFPPCCNAQHKTTQLGRARRPDVLRDHGRAAELRHRGRVQVEAGQAVRGRAGRAGHDRAHVTAGADRHEGTLGHGALERDAGRARAHGEGPGHGQVCTAGPLLQHHRGTMCNP